MEHGELRQHDDVGMNKILASGRPTSHSLFYAGTFSRQVVR